LKLKFDEPLSNVAFEFNFRHYIAAVAAALAVVTASAGALSVRPSQGLGFRV
jgi:hypothetical protein